MVFLTAEDRKPPVRVCLVFALVSFLTVFHVIPAWAADFRADQVKAAFIYNLVSFVNWREEGGQAVDSTFVIAVIGEDEIARNLEIITKDERIRGKKVVIKRYASTSEALSCDVLFLGMSSKKEISKILESVRNRAILTVGDSRDFTRLGGMVALVQQGKHIFIEINLQAAEEAGIHFSSKLLKVARIVRLSR